MASSSSGGKLTAKTLATLGDGFSYYEFLRDYYPTGEWMDIEESQITLTLNRPS